MKRLAYADPPYVGQAKRHYGELAQEVNLPLLIAHLQEYDGWALSFNAKLDSLRTVIDILPADARVSPWVKSFVSFKPGVNPAYAWEAIAWKPARKLGRDIPTMMDWVKCRITMRRGIHGVKPNEFCYWIFGLLAARPGDDLTDLFPGSGAVTKAWASWSNLWMPL